MTTTTISTRGPIQVAGMLSGLAGLVMLMVMAGSAGGIKRTLAVLIGGFAGFALYHASFGFTAAWRRVVSEGRGAGLRAQFVLIILTSAISYPLIAGSFQSIFGLQAGGFVFPVGIGMMFGAFVFGFGMQFGGGCGSGTLFVAGGGSTRMMITLGAFVAGSLLGTAHVPWWNSLARMKGWSMVREFGPLGAFFLLAAVLLVIGLYTIRREKQLYGELEKPRATSSYIQGPWSPMAGVIAIAIVGIATLVVVGRPWGITSAYALWGAKIATFAGMDLSGWAFWKHQMGRIERSVFSDVTSIMNFGILAGAMIAAALASRYRPVFSLSLLDISTAIFGGLLMGYGARLAYGCNIGAYLGGLISGSLHGWVWMIAAFVGSTLAVMFKTRFRI